MKHLILIALFALLPLWYYLFVSFIVWLFLKTIWESTVGRRCSAARLAILSLSVFGQCSSVAQASEATLKIERRGSDVILYVTGGTSNVQYQVWTPASNNPADTNSWYYWRRIYSRDFLSNPGYGEVLVYGTNTSQQPKRCFQIRGILPD